MVSHSTPARPDPKDELERALASEGFARVWVRRGIVAGVVALLVAGALVARVRSKPAPPPKYVVAEVTKGDVVERIQATGNVQALLSVNVGSQANGRVTRVLVDFNSVVKKGDLLAEIDSSVYGAQVTQSQATLSAQTAQMASSKANAVAAKAQFERIKKLQAQGLASQGEFDTARGQYEVAQAQYEAASAQAQAIIAQVSQAKANAGYTKIFAPVDGMVISRAIDPGATVVASFQTPTLFVIAQDLKRMRVIADVDEADVGHLREGMEAEATVDAFPGEGFHGKVLQLRFSPNNVQGVVTYAAILEVDNPEDKLRPGMTATVTVKTNEALNHTRVPNAALRFKPSPPLGADGKPVAVPSEAKLPKDQGRVFVEQGPDKVEPRIVKIGPSDGSFTSVDGLPAGSKVVIDETDDPTMKKGKGP